MKKILLLSLILFLGFGNLKAQEKKEIVPGTRVSINPPIGFTQGKNFNGFQKGEEAIINIMDFKSGNFYSNAASFTKEKFEGKGVKVLEFEELTIDGYPATCIMQGDPNAISVNMVFGDSTFPAMVMGLYPPRDKRLGEEIKKQFYQCPM